MFIGLQHLLGKIVRMSTVDGTSSVLGMVGHTAIQIAVPLQMGQSTTSDVDLEAAVHRVATLLYIRSRFEVPSDVIDMGGGLFNVVV